MPDISDLRRQRADAVEKMEKAAATLGTLEEDENASEEDLSAAQSAFDEHSATFENLDKKIAREEDLTQARAKAARVENPARPTNPEARGEELGYFMAALASTRGVLGEALDMLDNNGFGGVSAAMSGATREGGGVLIPDPLSGTLIELLNSRVVVRASGATVFNMPAGQIRHASQTAPATANYIDDGSAIPVSEPKFSEIDQSYKTLAAMVPIQNSLLDFSNFGLGRLVRDDILRQMARAEDMAFLRGTGGSNKIKGLRNWALADHWFEIASNDILLIESALRRMIDVVEDAGISIDKGGWVMRPSVKNFLASLRHAGGGNFIFPSIEASGALMGYPIKTTTNVPNNLGTTGDGTEIYFANFSDIMIGDAKKIIFKTSTEASYVDASGKMISAFQNDRTLMSALSRHDLAPRYDVAISGATVKGWSLATQE